MAVVRGQQEAIMLLQALPPKGHAYAIAWMAEQSGRRIDLDRIWREQRLSPQMSDAMKKVCAAAHRHIASQEGNPGEASKRESCWVEFRKLSLSIPDGWRNELSDTTFSAADTEEDALASEWERVRHEFINDSRTVGELEVLTGKLWAVVRRGDPVNSYAARNWDQLRAMRGMGLKKTRRLVEIFSVAALR